LLQDINRAVGERIRKLRLKKAITQDQFAELAGLNRVHLYRLESGRQSMTLNTLKTIADALGVPAARPCWKDLIAIGGWPPFCRRASVLLADSDYKTGTLRDRFGRDETGL
jgi:transcriptional regulator with XRE-family HTH domain